MELRLLTILTILATNLTLWASTSHPPKAGREEFKKCLSTREYITTLKFLRGRQEFQLPEKMRRTVADKVSLGCSGASQRFIDVTTLLVKSQLDGKSAVKIGISYALSDDQKTKSFITIFKQSFLSKYLDLDIFSAIKMAQGLSLEQHGNAAWIVKDFNRLVKFCIKKEGLDLPLPACAKMATTIASLGGKFKERIARPFLDLYHFLINKNGGGLPLHQALKISRQVIKMGPNAPKNFILAYKYGVRPKGMELSSIDAIAFATKMAKRSIQEIAPKK
ncbi:MAG: hypothetical protein HN353_05145 [Bdellovibrionales bacterium]|jgi:hypothetical protein|nr:hypothetical protein [Bdellovibrionales bacterium]MBT3525036.1 hypothetical protein [Bdellovibrionales bacterium]MBT7668377.1 hypothetical protein [Bdellovibrionales bacterium]MBT7768165.1 hypothetical protein [Bdellovibrionales bacterium]